MKTRPSLKVGDIVKYSTSVMPCGRRILKRDAKRLFFVCDVPLDTSEGKSKIGVCEIYNSDGKVEKNTFYICRKRIWKTGASIDISTYVKVPKSQRPSRKEKVKDAILRREHPKHIGRFARPQVLSVLARDMQKEVLRKLRFTPICKCHCKPMSVVIDHSDTYSVARFRCLE
jgi:hypothetical protein